MATRWVIVPYRHRNLAQLLPYTVLHDAPKIDAVVRPLRNTLPMTAHIRRQRDNCVVQRFWVRCIVCVGRCLRFLLEKEFKLNAISNDEKMIRRNTDAAIAFDEGSNDFQSMHTNTHPHTSTNSSLESSKRMAYRSSDKRVKMKIWL